jgi:hypothetical protein
LQDPPASAAASPTAVLVATATVAPAAVGLTLVPTRAGLM